MVSLQCMYAFCIFYFYLYFLHFFFGVRVWLASFASLRIVNIVVCLLGKRKKIKSVCNQVLWTKL